MSDRDQILEHLRAVPALDETSIAWLVTLFDILERLSTPEVRQIHVRAAIILQARELEFGRDGLDNPRRER